MVHISQSDCLHGLRFAQYNDVNWFSFHVASGASLFSGAVLLSIGGWFSSKSSGTIKFLWKLAASVGATLVLLSSTPWPPVVYLAFLALFLGWIISESISHWRTLRGMKILRSLLIASTVLLALMEIPSQQLPKMPNFRYEQMYIVGDSISAGIDERPNWGELFQKRYTLRVDNLAKPAATLGSALKQLDFISRSDCLVLLEIGGNDVLGNANSRDFKRDLSDLLIALNKPGRTIIMFELPLLPGQARLGRIQRSLAKQHGVYLIPKRYFCKVLGATGATTDGLHLSSSGSSLMAETIHGIVGDLLIQQIRKINNR